MKALVDAIKDDVHAPSMFRITGTMSNSKEFAEAYKCKKSNRMNPKDKNQIWWEADLIWWEADQKTFK